MSEGQSSRFASLERQSTLSSKTDTVLGPLHEVAIAPILDILNDISSN